MLYSIFYRSCIIYQGKSYNTLMKRHEIITSLLLPILEMGGIVGIFFIAYHLRQITDGIPMVQLRIPYISPDQFTPFIISGTLLWGSIFGIYHLYRYEPTTPLWETVRRVIVRSSMWFIFYVAFVYLTTGFIFVREIPRLIIGYVYVFSTLYAILLRYIVYTTMGILYSYGYISKNQVLVIEWEKKNIYHLEEEKWLQYIHIGANESEKISDIIRKKWVDTVLLMADMDEWEISKIIELCSIYGVTFSYPSIPQYVYSISREDGFIWGIPIVRGSALAMSAWDRILKRSFDIVFSTIALIILSPVFLLISLAIWVEDPSGPIIYRNRRIWLGGNAFSLYKFRYMYWKYSVKDAYGIDALKDEALQYEESLKKKSDTRTGPLYKIANDPRKTHIGKIIERLSLDELPQLWNVLCGSMSLVWPRPHQPREVELYEERHHQVLTTKPGITGMAQIWGREKNSFDEEVAYDVYYIEHYSFLLDIVILMKTIGVVIARSFR